MSIKDYTLEERCTQAMRMIGYELTETPPDSMATVTLDRSWRFDEKGVLKDEYYDMAQEIGKYETEMQIPEEKSVTNWFGDMELYEIKENVTKEEFLNAYEKTVDFREKEITKEQEKTQSDLHRKMMQGHAR